jgi:O-succinylbenzoate synthase
VRNFIDFDDALVFAIPTRAGVREGVLVEGPQGWGEFSPPADAGDALAARWLTAAMEPSTVGWPDAVRGRVPVAGARIAVVEVDDTDSAVTQIERLQAGGSAPDMVELVCRSAADAHAVRRRTEIPVAIDAAMLNDGRDADIAVLRCGPLGGVRRALRRAEKLGLPSLVDYTGITSIGLAADVALAAALPDLRFALGPSPEWLEEGDVVSLPRSLFARDGFLPAAPMPAAPDPARVAQFAVSDTATVERWRDLMRRAAAALPR